MLAKPSLMRTCTSLLIIIVLIGLGVALFFVREKKIPDFIGHELRINAKKSTQRIITDRFLILIHPSRVKELPTILEPLGLELKMPILNWLLVTRKNNNDQKIVQLDSPSASESQLTLSSLLQHPHILDAQHDYVVDTTLSADNLSFTKDWQFKDTSSHTPFSMNVTQAWDITTGTKDISIAVVDQFLSADNFTFHDRFKDCQKRVSFLQPLPLLYE